MSDEEFDLIANQVFLELSGKHHIPRSKNCNEIAIKKELLFDLTDNEIKVLEVLGKLHISKSKNCNEKTIKKKLPSPYHSELSDTIRNLHSKGLLTYYRKENYALTKEGKKIAEELAKKLTKKLYSDLHILLIL